jgi:hypothetical protein
MFHDAFAQLELLLESAGFRLFFIGLQLFPILPPIDDTSRGGLRTSRFFRTAAAFPALVAAVQAIFLLAAFFYK